MTSRLEPTQPHVWSYIRNPSIFVLALVASMVVYWGLLQASHDQMRVEARVVAQRLASQAAHALAMQLNTAVREVDHYTRHLGLMWLEENPAGFDEGVSVSMSTLPRGGIVSVSVVDAKGDVVYSRLSGKQANFRPLPVVTIQDREHFKVHTKAGSSILFVSEPVKGRISQQWTVQFARGLWHEGRFAGVIVISVSTEYLSGTLKSIFPDATDAASLVNASGVYLARSYYLSEVLGTKLPASRPFILFPEKKHGEYEVRANVDQTDRLYSWRRLDEYPLVVLVGLGAQNALANTEQAIRDSRWQSGGGSAVLLLTALVVAWQWARGTRREAIAQKVRESLELATQGGNVGIWDYEVARQKLGVNSLFCKLLGLNPMTAEITMSNWEDLLHPEDKLRFTDDFVSCIAGKAGAWSGNYRMKHTDGRVLQVAVHGRVVELDDNGHTKRCAGTLQDVTRSHQTAVALKESETRLRTALSAVRDGLWEFNHQTHEAHWDRAIRDMLGYHDAPSVLSLEALLGMMHPGDYAQKSEEARRIFSGDTVVAMDIEFRLRKADGHWLWVQARGNVVERLPQGYALRSVGTISDISRRVAEAQLRDALLNRSSSAILLTSPHRKMVEANAKFSQLFLKPGQSYSSMDVRQVHADDASWERFGLLYNTVRTKGFVSTEHLLKAADGRLRWFDVQGVLQDPEDPDSNIIWTWTDVTDRHDAMEALTIETTRLSALIQNFPGGVLIEDDRDSVAFVNEAWGRLLGLDIEVRQIIGLDDLRMRELLGPTISGWLRSAQPGRSGESRKIHEVATPQGIYLEIEHVEIQQDDKCIGFLWLLRDITDRKQRELELTRLASTDVLTGLPNRRSFTQSLQHAHRQTAFNHRPPSVVMMLDIDFFKRVNDSYGHAVGDVALQHVAQIMRETVRATDVPGRLGGEEFAVLLPHTNLAIGLEIAERIRKRIESAVIKADEHRIQITISIGVSVLNTDTPPEIALQQADDALYHVKQTGRNGVRAFMADVPFQGAS
ncbi:diguanylate cyclase [Ottowia caeni]|uniref:diguanylate cyclase n=1 Tax=Ottowia caeni TaxID=2870339 RepID=UPI001E309B6C|nr:diguanylate cyclase [Ottowia caeni]